MSLDVYLIAPVKETKECFHCGSNYQSEVTLFEANITHNLNKMADQAGIYEALWRPEEIDCKIAHDLIGKLGLGLDVLKKEPEHFKQWNPSNGWGNYENLVSFVERYLNACIENPNAIISVSR